MALALAAYRSLVLNILAESAVKYTNDYADSAIRRALSDYTRAFPDVCTATLTVAAAGRTQSLSTLTSLMGVIAVIHPYLSTAADPWINRRADYVLDWTAGSPQLTFQGSLIPQAADKIFVKYLRRQFIRDLDSAAATTVRDDHELYIAQGAAGYAAMSRASTLNEQWGGRPGEMSQLMQWGRDLVNRFLMFLESIKLDFSDGVFNESGWKLDQWDKHA